ncbi:MAG: glycoside hydrolase family 3 protein [Phycicoccus sp.]
MTPPSPARHAPVPGAGRARGRTSATLAQDVTATLQPGFLGATVPTWLVRAGAQGLVSVCLYGDNAADDGLASVATTVRRVIPDVLVATDEEGGDVTRVHYPGGSPAVGNAVLGRLDDLDATRASAAAVGAELGALGIRLDLGPVVDVNSSPDNPVIGVRSFGADPGLVARHATAWVHGLRSAGIAACAKHFPGHGDTVVDSHHGLPRVDVPIEVLRERELVPFRAAVSAGVDAVMTSHVLVDALDPENPATFSPTAIGVLRDELGFDGVVVSDALDMAGASGGIGVPEAAVRALGAGVDLLCLGSGTTGERFAGVRAAIVAAVGSGRLSADRVSEAAWRVRRLAARYAGPSTPSGATHVIAEEVVVRAFRLSDDARAWLADPAPAAVVQVGGRSNLAVGEVAWGPAAVGAATADVAATADAVVPADVVVPAGAKIAVVGRGVDSDHPAGEAVTRLRGLGHRVVLVECGWPRGGADVETFGGSPAVARALLALLRGEVAAP